MLKRLHNMPKSALKIVASSLGQKSTLFDLEQWNDDAGAGGNWYIRAFYRGKTSSKVAEFEASSAILHQNFKGVKLFDNGFTVLLSNKGKLHQIKQTPS